LHHHVQQVIIHQELVVQHVLQEFLLVVEQVVQHIQLVKQDTQKLDQVLYVPNVQQLEQVLVL
jgi:hypothetical protein